MSRGGTNEPENLVAACHWCNQWRDKKGQINDAKTCRECGGPRLGQRRKCGFCRTMDRERYQRLKVLGVLA